MVGIYERGYEKLTLVRELQDSSFVIFRLDVDVRELFVPSKTNS